MAGGDSVAAHRKALRKKELKKNKEKKEEARKIATVKKDTRSLEADIKRLADAAQRRPLAAADTEQLASLRAELARVQKAKQEYVELHPEHHKFVYPERKEASTSAAPESDQGTGLYTKDGKLRYPERSLYYDPVFNPFGAPPPGMPYRERPPTAEELAARLPPPPPEPLSFPAAMQEDEDDEEGDSDDESDNSDDDIALPEGPPPEARDDDSSSESGLSDIEMPEGPPPPPKSYPLPPRPIISRPSGAPTRPKAHHFAPPARPFHPNPHVRNSQFTGLPPRPQHAGFIDPMSYDQAPIQPYQARHHGPMQPTQPQPQSAPSIPPPPANAPPPPPGFLPFPGAVASGGAATATISAAPQLRDLKKEATAFVPSHMRKKKAPVSAAPRVNAAPGMEASDGVVEPRTSLKDTLSGVGIGGDMGKSANNGAATSARDKGKEDYEKFQKDLEEFL